MFGYVTVNRDELNPAELARFSALYCGLCRTLRDRHGLTGQMALSYDMTFLLTVLTALYEPEERAGASRCGVHPGKKHAYAVNEMSDYAADMTVALSYHKLRDDWNDQKSIAALSAAKLLKKRYRAVSACHPRQCRAIEEGVKALTALEKDKCTDLDAPVNCFGRVLGELFVYRDDVWSGTLREMGAALGRFIYLMDAYDDLEKDAKKGRYNPLLPLRGERDFEERVKEMLTLLIAECTRMFERLPIVNDLGLLRNILYSGVWSRYVILRQKRFGAKGDMPNG